MTETLNPLNPDKVPDVLIIGAGIIGLSIALELHSRGARVRVLERGTALQQASIAAAGMLAAEDPHNPAALHPFARHSLSLYPSFLQRIAALSGVSVPFQTHTTIQHLQPGKTLELAEHSLDPRQLAAALLKAVRQSGIEVREYSSDNPGNMSTADQPKIVYAQGAWTLINNLPGLVTPRKGQMLRVDLPPTLRGLREVHRSEHIYIVPRTTGPQAGTALLGATVEEAGFDTDTHPHNLRDLRALASQLLPAISDEDAAPQQEAWAGLRPATPDQLPILGWLDQPGHIVATGHYRNGILLAPATADAIANLIEGKTNPVDLHPFSPQRFERSHSHIASDIRPTASDNG